MPGLLKFHTLVKMPILMCIIYAVATFSRSCFGLSWDAGYWTGVIIGFIVALA